MDPTVYPLPIHVATLPEDMRKATQNITIGHNIGRQWAQCITDQLSTYVTSKVESPDVLRRHLRDAWNAISGLDEIEEHYMPMYHDRLDEMIDSVSVYIESLRPGGEKDALREFVAEMLDGSHFKAANVQLVRGVGGEDLPYVDEHYIYLKANPDRQDFVLVSRTEDYAVSVEWNKKDAVEFLVGHMSDCSTHVSEYFPYFVAKDTLNPALEGIFSKGTRRWDQRLFHVHHRTPGFEFYTVYGSTSYWRWVDHCDPKAWFGKTASPGNV